MKKYFGTDGIRGRAGDPLTPELVLRSAYGLTRQLGGRAAAYHAAERPLVVLASDARLSAPMLKAAATAGLNLGGFDVLDLGIVPTPLVPLTILARGAQGGLMVTASHNPVEDNGLKFFGPDGQKISSRAEDGIEAAIEASQPIAVSDKLHFGSSAQIDPTDNYLAFLRKHSEKGKGPAQKVVLDCAYGAASKLGPLAFEQAGFEVKAINARFDGSLCNVGCGATDLSQLKAAVKKHKADFGLAFDGDGDRVLAVDHSGNAVSGDRIIAILATQVKRYREQKAVVMTKMTNLGVEEALAARGIAMKRTEVGDIQVLAGLRRHKLWLGGEQSGHIIMLDKLPSGDGILAGLQLATVLRGSGRSLSELASDFPEYPQLLTNLRVRDKLSWKDDEGVKRRLSGIMSEHRQVRFYLRPSGTENLIRVLTEASDADECRTSNAEVCQVFEEWSKRSQ